MHFYRALYRDSIQAEGFEIYHLTRQLNPEYEASPHKSSNTEGSIIVKEISLIPTYVNQKLANKPWKREEILRKTDISGLLGIVFPDYLYVVYTKRKEETYFKNIYRPPGVPAYETTVVTLPVKPHYLLIDKNGTIANDQSPMYEGTWSKSRIARLLPVDFVPTTKR